MRWKTRSRSVNSAGHDSRGSRKASHEGHDGHEGHEEHDGLEGPTRDGLKFGNRRRTPLESRSGSIAYCRRRPMYPRLNDVPFDPPAHVPFAWGRVLRFDHQSLCFGADVLRGFLLLSQSHVREDADNAGVDVAVIVFKRSTDRH